MSNLMLGLARPVTAFVDLDRGARDDVEKQRRLLVDIC